MGPYAGACEEYDEVLAGSLQNDRLPVSQLSVGILKLGPVKSMMRYLLAVYKKTRLPVSQVSVLTLEPVMGMMRYLLAVYKMTDCQCPKCRYTYAGTCEEHNEVSGVGSERVVAGSFQNGFHSLVLVFRLWLCLGV